MAGELEKEYRALQEKYEKLLFELHHVQRARVATLESLFIIESKNGTEFKFPEKWKQEFERAESVLKDFSK